MEKLPAPRPQNISLCSPPQQGNNVGFYRKRCSRPVRSQLLTPPPGATLQARPETETSLVPLPGTQGSCSFSQEAIRISSPSSQLPPRAAEGSGLCPPPSQGRHSSLSPLGQSLGCHDKLPRTGRLKQSFIFPQTQRLGVQDQVPASLVSGWDSPCERARELFVVPSHKATKPVTSVRTSTQECGGGDRTIRPVTMPIAGGSPRQTLLHTGLFQI